MPSKIQVDSIATEQNTAPTLTQGATIPSGKTISGAGNINVVGVLTASNYSGNGTQLTGISFATIAKAIGISLIGG